MWFKIKRDKTIYLHHTISQLTEVEEMEARKLKALEILVSGDYRTYEEVADRLKINRRTLYNWRNEEEFSKELDRRIRIVVGGIAPRALKKLDELIDSKNEQVALQAAKDMLDRGGFKAAEKIDLNGKTESSMTVSFEGELNEWSE